MCKNIFFLGIIFLIIPFYLEAQVDSSRAEQIVQQQVHVWKQQVQQQVSSRNKRSESEFRSIINSRKEAKQELNDWRDSKLNEIRDSTPPGERPEKQDQVYKVYYSRIEELNYEFDVNMRELYYHDLSTQALVVLPSKFAYTTSIFYGSENGSRASFFDKINLQYGLTNGSFESNIVEGYLGPVKGVFSTVLAKQEVETVDPTTLTGLSNSQIDSALIAVETENIKNNSLLRLISGGGEANLKLLFPLLIAGDERGYTPLLIKSDLRAQVSGILPIVGNDIPENEVYLFNTAGINLEAAVSFQNYEGLRRSGSSFWLFGRVQVNNVGGTDLFYKSIEVQNNQRFWYTELSGGLILDHVVISYTNQIFGGNLSDKNLGRLSVTYQRKINKKKK